MHTVAAADMVVNGMARFAALDFLLTTISTTATD